MFVWRKRGAGSRGYKSGTKDELGNLRHTRELKLEIMTTLMLSL